MRKHCVSRTFFVSYDVGLHNSLVQFFYHAFSRSMASRYCYCQQQKNNFRKLRVNTLYKTADAAETTIFWPYYSGKCRTVGTYSPRRNHRRAMASRKTEKTVDTRHWRVDWLRIRSAKEMSQDRAQWRRKISEWSSSCCRLPSSRKVD